MIRRAAADDHRVGDVVDVHLVEADQAVALGYEFGERAQGVLAAFQFLEFPVHVAHEVVEMHAALSPPAASTGKSCP